MQKLNLLLFLCAVCFFSCRSQQTDNSVFINPGGTDVKSRIKLPLGYVWVEEQEGSFGHYLLHASVLRDGTKVLKYNGEPIWNQSNHVAVLNYDVGTRDLQQCADAVMRLRAEYLYRRKEFDKISFHFVSGESCNWNDYRAGKRPDFSGRKMVMVNRTAPSDDHTTFRKYLDLVFAYASTLSLYKETRELKSGEEIMTGDFIITPGSPGHTVIVVGRAKNTQGNFLYLLAQSFMPAQSIHILKNPSAPDGNPWYTIELSKPSITPGWDFNETRVHRF